jgi:hypothetical protein
MSRALVHVAFRPPAAARGPGPRRAPRSSRARAPVSRPSAASDPGSSAASSETAPSPETADAEAVLLARLRAVSGRGAGASEADERAIAEAVSVLERGGGGLSHPASRPEIEGTWRLLYTSKSRFDARNPLGKRVDGAKPGLEGLFAGLFGDEAAKEFAVNADPVAFDASSSPIQRSVTSLEAFTIQQAIRLFDPATGRAARARRRRRRRRARGPGGAVRERELLEALGESQRFTKRCEEKTESSSRSTWRTSSWRRGRSASRCRARGRRACRTRCLSRCSGTRRRGGWTRRTSGRTCAYRGGTKVRRFVLVREAEEANGGAPLPYEF